jgi:hypothetical protein
VNYRQWISSALLKMGDQDHVGAAADFAAALEEAQRIDPEGPRVAEVLQYLAHFEEGQARPDEAAKHRAQAEAIFKRFEVPS